MDGRPPVGHGLQTAKLHEIERGRMSGKKTIEAEPGALDRGKAPHGRVPKHQRSGLPNLLRPLWLAFLVILLFFAFSFIPRVSANPRLAGSFWGASAVLLVFLFLLRRQVIRAGRTLRYDFVARPVHYVQLAMHSSVYAYWGWYWRDVYHYIPLIIAQLILAYAFDMLVCWSRRDEWVLGFGPFPIVLSTNLFLWFRDDWFFLQFLMIAVGVLGKEFVKWNWEGRRTHIFNPSAFSLFIFSVALLVTHNTPITWGEEIASTLSRPPNIYLEIFVLGLVVQALFSVTLVTLSAATSLYVMNLIFTHSTGVYHFVDSNIPVSVFLGLHLLVTDPATSPRTTLGKIVFGGSYGAAVFGLYGFLGWLGVPRFYDKLLCVPPLNLTVRALDRASRALAVRFRSLDLLGAWSPRRANFAYMGVWCSLFVLMMSTGFLGKSHPGRDIAFWQRACTEGRRNACQTWVHALNVECRADVAAACFTLAKVSNEGRVVPRDASEAGKGFGRACDLGIPSACASLKEFVRAEGKDVFERACDRGDGAICFILGSLYHKGDGVTQDDGRALALFRQSCASGWWRGCGRLGESYLWGEGTVVDLSKALESFEKGCGGRYAPSCFNAAMMYRRGLAGPKDEPRAHERLGQACALGLQPACQQIGNRPAVPTRVADPEASGL